MSAATIRLDTILRSLRDLDDTAAVRSTMPWRMGILGQICQIVEHAHARGLAHPGLSTRAVLVEDTEVVRISGWMSEPPPDTFESDLHALGVIAEEILTLAAPSTGDAGDTVEIAVRRRPGHP